MEQINIKESMYGGLAQDEWDSIKDLAKSSIEARHFVQIAKLDHTEIGKAFDQQLCFVVRHNHKVSEPFV